MNANELKKTQKENRTGGLILIGIGLIALVSQFIDIGSFGILIVPVLGIAFLIAGVVNRDDGYMIPGGILSGIGLGILLIAGPFESMWSEDASGGVFMLSFAAGWALIVLMTAVFTDETHYWPLIPGGIMAVIGMGIVFGGFFMSALTFIGQAWPVGLIAVGAYILVQSNRHPELAEKSE